MFGFGHPSTCPQRCLRPSLGRIIIHFDHLLVVSITVAEPHQHLFSALLAPMSPGHDTSLDRLDSQAGLWHHRARRCCARPPPQATGFQAATPCPGTCGPTPPTASRQGARPPDHVSPCLTAPPPGSALPRPPADAATTRGAPSHRHRPSSDAAACRTRVRHQHLPRPTGDACGSLSPLAERQALVETGLLLGPCFGQGQPPCPRGYDLCWTPAIPAEPPSPVIHWVSCTSLS